MWLGKTAEGRPRRWVSGRWFAVANRSMAPRGNSGNGGAGTPCEGFDGKDGLECGNA